MGDYRDYNYDNNLYVKLENFHYYIIRIKVYKKNITTKKRDILTQ